MQYSKPMSGFELGQFLVHGRGLSLSFWRLPGFTDLPVSEQAFCYLLGRELILPVEPIAEIASQELLQIIGREKLASYCLNQLLSRPGLADIFSEAFARSLRRLAIQESLEYETITRDFAYLHQLLNDFQIDVLWLKGSGLAVMVYGDPSYRIIADFDLLCQSRLAELTECFTQGSYELDLFRCAQVGVGPIRSLVDLSLQPGDEWVACGAMALWNPAGGTVDFKLDPLERGVKFKEQMRIWSESVQVEYAGKTIRCPGFRDQLVIACCHLHKDYFEEYRRILDVHLIVLQLTPEDWPLVVRQAKVEGISDSIWAGLALAQDRFLTKVPPSVMRELRPCRFGAKWYALALNYRFLWNQNPLVALLMHCVFAEDRDRKNKALAAVFFPPTQFLSAYYAAGKPLNIVSHLMFLLLHWCVIAWPANMVRKTIGSRLWTYETVFRSESTEVPKAIVP